MQAGFWGKGNWDESSRSSSIFLWQSTVIWDGCSQHLGSLIASSQTCAICIISGLACVKRQEKTGCQMPLSWISGWRGYTSEVLQGILRLAGELMAFDTLLRFLFGMRACLWVRETDSWEELGSPHSSVTHLWLLWDVRYAAALAQIL